MEETNKNKEQKDDAITAAYMLGRYDGRKEAGANISRLTEIVDFLAGGNDSCVGCPILYEGKCPSGDETCVSVLLQWAKS